MTHAAGRGPGTLVTIGTAVRAREILRFDYDGGSSPCSARGRGVQAPRRVEPHHLVTWGGRWYLVAWDLEREDWRTFRVDRMAPRTPGGPRFAPGAPAVPAPGGGASSMPDVAAYVTHAFSRPRWPVEGEVVLHVRADTLAPWVGDQG
ncbi:WYL domain-containing protein [Oerskovia sp. M15]